MIVWESPWNKYKRDNRPPEHLWDELQKASDRGTAEVLQQTGLPWITLDTALAHTVEPTWLVDGWWMESNVGWIAAEGKSYKSTVALDLALSIASGKPFLGQFKVNAPGPVLMVEEEDPLWRVATRLRAMIKGKGLGTLGLTETEIGTILQIKHVNPIPFHLAVGGGFSFLNPKKIEALEQALDQYHPKLLILDPFFMLEPRMMDNVSATTETLNLLKQWRNNYGCAIAVIHHFTKNGGDGSAPQRRLFGFMQLYAWSENSWFFDRKRGTNIVKIERDIKDSEALDPIALNIADTAKTWSFAFINTEVAADVTPAESRVKEVLLDYVGQTISKAQLMTHNLGLSEKTVTTALKKFAKMGIIEVAHKGQGGQAFITIKGGIEL